MSDDLPRSGRPMMASATGGLFSGRSASPGISAGSSASIVSSNVEIPRPCAALMGSDAGEIQGGEIRLQVLVFRIVDLVHDEHDWRARLAQHLRELLVDWGEAVLRIDDEEDDVALPHGCIRGRADFGV
jgi:hypothetical protein